MARYTWVGTHLSDPDDWNDPNNWQPSGVPGSNGTVTIGPAPNNGKCAVTSSGNLQNASMTATDLGTSSESAPFDLGAPIVSSPDLTPTVDASTTVSENVPTAAYDLSRDEEEASTSPTLVTLASFNGTNGLGPDDLVFDSAGDRLTLADLPLVIVGGPYLSCLLPPPSRDTPAAPSLLQVLSSRVWDITHLAEWFSPMAT